MERGKRKEIKDPETSRVEMKKDRTKVRKKGNEWQKKVRGHGKFLHQTERVA